MVQSKKNDQTVQAIGAVFALVFAPFTFCMSFCILGAIHAFSTIFWLFATPKEYVYGPRKVIQIINIIVLAVWGGSLMLSGTGVSDLFGKITLAMIFAGPVLGTVYYIITVKEIGYYSGIQEELFSSSNRMA